MYKRLSSKIILKHPRLVVEEDEVQIQTGEKIQYLRYGYGGDGVVIVTRNDNDQVLFIRDYSYVPDRKLLTLPMGKIAAEETPEAAANRELQEETDFKAEQLKQAGFYFQNHRRADNKGIVILATKLVLSPLEADKEEAGIESVWVPIDEISSLIEVGEIVDADTLSSLRICGL